MIKSVSSSQEDIIRGIMELEGIQRFDLDPTYSTGVFYQHIPQPQMRFDIEPRDRGVEKADVRHLPFPDGGIKSIMFDPPFLGGGGKTGIMKQRFGGFDSVPELWGFYSDSLKELARVIRKHGVLVVKCQDIVDSRQQHLSHFEIIYLALMNGFYPKDLYILTSNGVMRRHNHKNQQHARKHHSYFIVFKKSKRKQHYSCFEQRELNGKRV